MEYTNGLKYRERFQISLEMSREFPPTPPTNRQYWSNVSELPTASLFCCSPFIRLDDDDDDDDNNNNNTRKD